MTQYYYKRFTIALLIESPDSRRLLAMSLSFMALVGLFAACLMRVGVMVHAVDSVVAGVVTVILMAIMQVEGGARWSSTA